MHLAKRCSRHCLACEGCQFLLPVRAQLGRHTAAGEQPAHRRRICLEAGQLTRIFRRQGIRYGRQDLCHFHDRAFQPAKRLAQISSMFAAVNLNSQIAFAGHTGGKAGHGAGYPRIAAYAAANAAGISAFLLGHQDNPSSSSIMPDIISSPSDQKAGSRGSRSKRCKATS